MKIVSNGKELVLNGRGTASNLSAGEVYSTEETVIGKWIDGKTLYRKCITGTITALKTSIPLESVGIEYKRYTGYSYRPTNVSNLVTYVGEDDRYKLQSYIDIVSETEKILKISAGSGFVDGKSEYVFALEYTKTTDTPNGGGGGVMRAQTPVSTE